MVDETRKHVNYSIPGAILGSIVGAPIGTTLGVYTAVEVLKKLYENTRSARFDKEIPFLVIPTSVNGDNYEALVMLAIPTLLAAGASLGAYIGGRIFGTRE